jgi:hypothetical protein
MFISLIGLRPCLVRLGRSARLLHGQWVAIARDNVNEKIFIID